MRALSHLGQEARRLGAKRVLLVTDRGAVASGLVEGDMKQSRLFATNPRDLQEQNLQEIHERARWDLCNCLSKKQDSIENRIPSGFRR